LWLRAIAFFATGFFFGTGFFLGAGFLGRTFFVAFFLATGLLFFTGFAAAGFDALACGLGNACAEEGRAMLALFGGMISERAWGIATGLQRNSLLTATRPQLRQM